MTKNQKTKNSDALILHQEHVRVQTSAQDLLNAMGKAFHILGLPSNHENLTTAPTIKSCGEDQMFFEYQWAGTEISIYREVSLSHTLDCRVSISIKKHEKTPNRVQVVWSSGGGSVLVAMAQANYQLEIAQRAVRAETILAEVLSDIHNYKAQDRDFAQDVFEELARGATAAFANFKYTLAKERAAQELL